ncbi:hypothetical protein HDU96_010401 [Phlyctochytrium bullatum]|nr:hypothetical protein HDU96_010401 [Phlyctochytrium bullatum]
MDASRSIETSPLDLEGIYESDGRSSTETIDIDVTDALSSAAFSVLDPCPNFTNPYDLRLHLPLLITPRTTVDTRNGDRAVCTWIDKAIVEKFYNGAVFSLFEVVKRDDFIRSFEDTKPELRAAMCCFSAFLAKPRAPDAMFQRYYMDARRLLFEAVDNPTIATLQAAIVLSCLSTTMKVQMSMLKLDDPNTLRDPNCNRAERAVRDRCFWMGVFLDRAVSAMYARKAQVLPDYNTGKLLGSFPPPTLSDSEWYTLGGGANIRKLLSADDGSTPGLDIPLTSYPDMPEVPYISRVSSLMYDAGVAAATVGHDIGECFGSKSWQAALIVESQLRDFEDDLPRVFRFTKDQITLLLGDDEFDPLVIREMDAWDCSKILAIPKHRRKKGLFTQVWNDGYLATTFNRSLIVLLHRICYFSLHNQRLILWGKALSAALASPLPRTAGLGITPASQQLFHPAAARRLEHILRTCIASTRLYLACLRSIGLPACLSHQDYLLFGQETQALQLLRMTPTLASAALLQCVAILAWALVAEWRSFYLPSPPEQMVLDMSLPAKLELLGEASGYLKRLALLIEDTGSWVSADGVEPLNSAAAWGRILQTAADRYAKISSEHPRDTAPAADALSRMESEEILFLGGLQVLLDDVYARAGKLEPD